MTLRSIHLVTFLLELNGLKLIGINVGNACLTAKCREHCCCVVPKFFKHATNGDEMVGCYLEVVEALHRLRSSGAAFDCLFAGALQDLRFTPPEADPNVWLREAEDGSCCEHIAVYVDDLLCGLKDSDSFMSTLFSTLQPHPERRFFANMSPWWILRKGSQRDPCVELHQARDTAEGNM